MPCQIFTLLSAVMTSKIFHEAAKLTIKSETLTHFDGVFVDTAWFGGSCSYACR